MRLNLPRRRERANTRQMRYIPGGSFLMGCDLFYPEERPVRRVQVDGFWMDEHPVTVNEFRRFVAATGYVTLAERPLNPALYPDADPALLVPGALVFHRTAGPVDLRDFRNWWRYIAGASWDHPEGSRSNVAGRDRHPVTQVAYEDAAAYAAWAGKTLPTEAEWERAARGGREGCIFVWGDEVTVKGRQMANTWQGEFPWQNRREDGYEGTSPVGSFAPNGYGLYDMAGNVWEWTSDYYSVHRDDASHELGSAQVNPRVDVPPADLMTASIPRRVIKGGSHLCAPNYSLRYRPAARQGEAEDTSAGHLGFRCIIREPYPHERAIT